MNADSRHRKTRLLIGKWASYALLLLVCGVLQTTPGLLQIGQVKPIFILPLCVVVATQEGEFASALFGVAAGLLWDCTAGVIVGIFASLLLITCFCVSLFIQLYLRVRRFNVFAICAVCNLLVLTMHFLFFYYMPGHAEPWVQYGSVVLPMAFYGALFALPLFLVVQPLAERVFVLE